MRRRSNAWHDAIIVHLRAAGGPLTVEQIWQCMAAAEFRHTSKKPRSTLGARVAELAQMKVLERVGPATYRLSEVQANMSDMSQQPEENLS